jgi:ubiquinone/menaquinone biosynthesis methyltransferase
MMKEPFRLKAKDYLNSSEGKRLYNEKHFAESASRYDYATRGLSLGQDASWKRRMVAELEDRENAVCADIACGTGDVAFLLAGRFPDAAITGFDLTAEMITIANRRNEFPGVSFEQADMTRLPVEDSSVDILTGSYAIRNAPDLEEVMGEFRRIMKPGGEVALLDFSRAEGTWCKKIQYAMLRLWGGFWGLVLHGNPEVHGYIASSIRNFPDPETLEALFARFGFQVKKSRPFFFGMMRLYILSFLPLV